MDSITIPSLYIGTPDASLEVEADCYGDSYTMTLRAADGHVIASAGGFRPGACRDFGPDAHTAGTFGAFLSHALESSDDDARAGWDVITDDASDWADALALMEVDDD